MKTLYRVRLANCETRALPDTPTIRPINGHPLQTYLQI